jgi:hypothetical protein
MRLRQLVLAFVTVAVVAPPGVAAASAHEREQIAWVRRAAAHFVGAELRGDGADACSVLYAPLRAPRHRETCAQRWDARLARATRDPRLRAGLRADARAIPTAPVTVEGSHASISLPAPLMAGESRFVWNEMCWMLQR